MKFLNAIKLNPTISIPKQKVCPFISMENVDFHSREPLAYEMKAFSSGVKFEDGDTVIARITPCLQNGKGFYCKNIGQGFGSTEFLVFRPQNKAVDNSFLYYYLSTFNVRRRMINSMVGATGRQRVNNDVFKSMEVDFPPLPVQRRIADILSAYDDLIENNRKQIKLLEEAAQRLYKEWFVDLRFPGHEKIKITDGVPEGWERKPISGIGKVITGKTPSTANNDFYGNDIPFIKIPDMHGQIFPLKTEIKLSTLGANFQKSKYIPQDSIVVSCIATVGLVCITADLCQTNQQINSIVLYEKKHLYYLYFRMSELKMFLEGLGSNGATMTNVNKEKFENIEIIVPSKEIIENFYRIEKEYFDKILILSKQVLKLQEARDRLLPKLMNGEIEV